jgi:glycosyltransferase involved in cell wall biosynthesis
MVNLYKPKFTYIIPFRYKNDRIIPLRRVIEWLSGFQAIEIIVVEQDNHSKISNLNFKAVHIFTESDAPFNKSWAYNVGMKVASSNIIVFGDADFIMNPNELIESLKTLEHYDCVLPTSKVIKLDQQQSSMDFGNIFQISNSQIKMSMTDGISLYKKECILKLGGWNEDFLGLGFSNKFQDLKIKRMVNYKQMDYIGYHMYHNSEKMDFSLFQRNQQIIDHYSKPVSDLFGHVNVTIPKIGYKNKFQF